MLRRLKLFIVAAVAICCLVPALPAAAEEINVFKDVCNVNSGATRTSEACSVTGANPVTGSGGTIAKVTRLLAMVAGMAAVIIIIIGGILYVLSNGEPQKVTAAKDTVMYAAIGLAVIIFAQAIIIFIINKV